jgi:hypothetical protein
MQAKWKCCLGHTLFFIQVLKMSDVEFHEHVEKVNKDLAKNGCPFFQEEEGKRCGAPVDRIE